MPTSCTLLGGFVIGAWVSLLWQHSVEGEMSASACTRCMPGCRQQGLQQWNFAPTKSSSFYLICILAVTNANNSKAAKPGWAGTRKVKPIWILKMQEMMRRQWHQLDHMQIICTLLQTGNYTSTLSLIFTGRMLFVTLNQWCQSTDSNVCLLHETYTLYAWLLCILYTLFVCCLYRFHYYHVAVIWSDDHTTTPPQPFYGPFSGTTRVSWCQKRNFWTYGTRED